MKESKGREREAWLCHDHTASAWKKHGFELREF